MTFSHLDVGTDEVTWLSDPRLTKIRRVDLSGIRHVVVLAAHPDDETLGAGGLIAAAARQGCQVDVVVATNGEASHPSSPTTTPDQLAEVRRTEITAAVADLAPDAGLELLNLPDGRLAAHQDAVAAVLGRVLAGGAAPAPGVVLVAPWRNDGHTDHDAAGEVAARTAAAAGIRLLEYPIWLWHWGSPDDVGMPWPALQRFQLAAADVDAKRTAMERHRSQTAPLSDLPGDEALLGEGMQAHFERDFEVYLQTEPAQPHPDAGSVFDALHAGDTDPWRYTTSWYEKRKRAITLAALPSERYRRVLEVGCSIGVLTEELAARAEAVLATDVSDRALELAADRLAQVKNVRLERMQTPRQWPQGRFDLIVASEVAYYYSRAELEEFVQRCLQSLDGDGVLLACHWRHPVDGWPLDGDAVHSRLRAEAGLAILAQHVEEDFVLDVFVRPPARSVARREGLV